MHLLSTGWPDVIVFVVLEVWKLLCLFLASKHVSNADMLLYKKWHDASYRFRVAAEYIENMNPFFRV